MGSESEPENSPFLIISTKEHTIYPYFIQIDVVQAATHAKPPPPRKEQPSTATTIHHHTTAKRGNYSWVGGGTGRAVVGHHPGILS